MARSRFIKPEFFDDTVLARCSHPARLLFAALWQVADRLGVFEWDAARLRKYAFGYDNITHEQLVGFLSELLKNGLIKAAMFQDRPYGLVPNLSKHQKFHVAEKSKYDVVSAGAIWSSTLPAPCQHPADTVPESLSLFPVPCSLETENGERRTDLVAKVKKPKREKLPGATPTGVTVPIREAWKAEYQKKYGTEAAWGRRENGQAAQMLGTYPAAELLALVPYFFAWKRPEVIKGGHSFGKGAASFVLKIDELRADIADAERRKQAARFADDERQAERVISGISQAERVAAQLSGEPDEISRGNDQRRIGEGAGAWDGELREGLSPRDSEESDADGGDIQP